LLEALCRHAGVTEGGLSNDSRISIRRASCLGLCEHAPALLVGAPGQEVAIGRAAPEEAADLCQGRGYRPASITGGDLRILTANCGKGRPTTLAEYEAGRRLQRLRKALVFNLPRRSLLR